MATSNVHLIESDIWQKGEFAAYFDFHAVADVNNNSIVSSDDKSKQKQTGDRQLAIGDRKKDEQQPRADYLPIEHIYENIETDLQKGLTKSEAKKRLNRNGPNTLTRQRESPKWLLFIGELFSGFGPLFWFAATLSILSYWPLGGDSREAYHLTLGVVLLAILFSETAFRFFHLQTVSNLMNQFLGMLPAQASVLRDGKWMKIDARELVVGDVIRVSAGDRFPADVRAVEVSGAKMEASALTGETELVSLTTDCDEIELHEVDSAVIGETGRQTERNNLGYLGAHLVEGYTLCVVSKTGDRTAMGKVAKLAVTTSRIKTTLERDVHHFAWIIAAVALLLVASLWTYWAVYIRVRYPNAISVSALTATTMAVLIAFVPAGLPVAVTAALALGARRLREVKVLVKNLTVIETLGAANVVCSDKTGTITLGRMTLSHFCFAVMQSQSQSQSQSQEAPQLQVFDCDDCAQNDQLASLTLALAALCNSAQLDVDQHAKPTGSLTDCALLSAASQKHNVALIRQTLPKVKEVPFSSSRMRHVTVHSLTDPKRVQFLADQVLNNCPNAGALVIVKGAVETIIDCCTSCITNDGVLSFDQRLRTRAYETTTALAETGQRVLAVAMRLTTCSAADVGIKEMETQLCFVALVALVDPPRKKVDYAVSTCQRAGIRVAMVTGDHPSTAVSIARQVSIFTSSCAVWTLKDVRRAICQWRLAGSPGNRAVVNTAQPILILGSDLHSLEAEEWDFIAAHAELVFARMTPVNKVQIVERFQSMGNVVAVTGDGVNDAPALKKADVGIAMGVQGSQIAKDVANVVLLDDNFATIVNAVATGRLVFDNLRKVLCFMLPAGSFSEILPVLMHAFLGIPLAISPLLMIAICVGTDILGAVELVYEPSESDSMLRPARRVHKDHLVDWKVLFYAFLQIGMIESAIGLYTFYIALYVGSNGACGPTDLLFVYDWSSSQANYCSMQSSERAKLLREAQTAFFISIVIAQVWNLFTGCRTRSASVFSQPFRKGLLLNTVQVMIFVLCIVYIPFLNVYLGAEPVQWYCFMIPICSGCLMMVHEEIRKFFVRRYPEGLVAKLAW